MVTRKEPAGGQGLPQPHQFLGGALCLDFVNTVDRMLDKPWVDHLTSYADLCQWAEQAGSLTRARSRVLARSSAERSAAAVLGRAQRLREACYRVFLALAAGEPIASADLAAINAEVGEALAQLRVEPADGGYTWGWAQEGALAAPLWPIARSAAELLVSPRLALVKRCASSTCLWLFLDETKNHQRRWCDMKVCGNRAKVRAHRRRQARG